MIPLLVLGAVLGLVLLLLLSPVKLQVTFRREFSAQVRYLFFRLPLSLGEEPAPDSPQEGQPGPAPGAGMGKKLLAMLRREGLGGFLRSLEELAQAAGNASKALVRKVRLRRFDLYIRLGGAEDAAQAAMLYGQVCAAAYTACGVLLGLFPCPKPSVSVDLDYNSGEDQVLFSCLGSIRLLFLLKEGLILLYRALPFFRKLQGRENQQERISPQRKQGEGK